MSFDIIYKVNKREDEKIFLMGLDLTDHEDELGFSKTEFSQIQEIQGVIQRSQVQEVDFKGEESNPSYTGYFLPDFLLETDNIANYRIKYKRPHETLLLKIKEYNPNLFLKGKRDHIQIEMILEKKYGE